MKLPEIINDESVITEHIFDNGTHQHIVYTYENILETIEKFSNFFQENIPTAKVVAVYLPASFYTYMITLSLIAVGKIVTNVFYSYGLNALKTRLDIVKPEVLITTEEKKQKTLSIVKHVISSEEILSYSKHGKRNVWEDIKDEDLIAFHFTSGTTGMPKVVPHKFKDLVGVRKSFEEVFKPSSNRGYLCTADYGWVTGFYYGIFAPLIKGVRLHLIRNIDGTKILRFLSHMSEYHVNSFYTTPLLLKTAYRFFKRSRYFEGLKFFSVGEKLPKDIRRKYKEIGYSIIDTWWQTELGCITIADVKDRGVMGEPLLGIETAVLDRGKIMMLDHEVSGELLIKKDSHPSIMEGYYNNRKANEEKFIGQYYKTGDLVEWIPNKGFLYISRADDVIVVAGELISPDEIESFILENFEVSDVAVIQVKEKIVVFAVGDLNVRGVKKKIFQELSPAMVPDKIIIVERLPRTESGKIKRKVLQEMVENEF